MSQTLSGLPLAPIAPASLDATPPARPPSTIDRALTVVLERTRRGDEELTRQRFGLGAARRQLLGAVDAMRPLGELTQPDAAPNAQRLVSDAARLVAFGLCRAVRGELPRSFMVAAMNLTMRIPRMLAPVEAAPRSPAARAEPAQPEVTGEFRSQNDTRPLQFAAAIVAVLVLVWIVFEIVRA